MAGLVTGAEDPPGMDWKPELGVHRDGYELAPGWHEDPPEFEQGAPRGCDRAPAS